MDNKTETETDTDTKSLPVLKEEEEGSKIDQAFTKASEIGRITYKAHTEHENGPLSPQKEVDLRRQCANATAEFYEVLSEVKPERMENVGKDQTSSSWGNDVMHETFGSVDYAFFAELADTLKNPNDKKFSTAHILGVAEYLWGNFKQTNKRTYKDSALFNWGVCSNEAAIFLYNQRWGEDTYTHITSNKKFF